MAATNQEIYDTWRRELLRYGYLGVFIFSMLSNSIPYTAVPYLLVIILLAKNFTSATERIVLILFSTIGAVMGKLIVYFMGYGLSPIVSSSKIKPVLEILRKSKSIFLATIIFASLPLPDDVLYIPLGAIKYDLKRYAMALFIGKFMLTYIAVNLGLRAYWLLEQAAGLPIWVSIPIMVILTIYVIYIIMRINWNAIIVIGAKKTVFHAFLYFMYEVILKTVMIPVYIYRSIKNKCK